MKKLPFGICFSIVQFLSKDRYLALFLPPPAAIILFQIFTAIFLIKDYFAPNIQRFFKYVKTFGKPFPPWKSILIKNGQCVGERKKLP